MEIFSTSLALCAWNSPVTPRCMCVYFVLPWWKCIFCSDCFENRKWVSTTMSHLTLEAVAVSEKKSVQKYRFVVLCHFPEYMKGVEVRVGNSEDDPGIYGICHKQIDPIINSITTFTCLEKIFGDWVMFIKYRTVSTDSTRQLVLCEVRVYDSKYNGPHTDPDEMLLRPKYQRT